MDKHLNINDKSPLMYEESGRFAGCSNQIPGPDSWENFVHGDEASFKGLFKKYYTDMYGYGLKLCGEPEMVKDCIQELFKTLWEKRNDLNHIQSPNVYLFVSLRRMILKNLGKQKMFRIDLQEIDDSAFLSFGVEEVIITDEMKRQQKETLIKAMNQLSARQKEVVWLFFYNGMSYGEIEKILSIKRQSVCNLMYRSMETLRKLLKNNEISRLVTALLLFVLFFFPH